MQRTIVLLIKRAIALGVIVIVLFKEPMKQIYFGNLDFENLKTIKSIKDLLQKFLKFKKTNVKNDRK